MKNSAKVAITVLISSAAIGAHNTNAQDDEFDELEGLGDGFQLEEIVVTARKRFEMVQDIPISMIVVTGDELKEKSVVKLEDLTPSIPSVHVAEATIGNNLFVRGLGSGINSGFEQTVGTFVDGLYYGKGQLSRYPFFDLERIEILKGPQGILFGKNTVAGALSITTADPSAEFMGEVISLYEFEHEEYNVSGVLSGPIGSESLRGRLSFMTAGREGWMENTLTDDDEPSNDILGLRTSLAWDPTDNMEVLLKLSRAEIDIEGRPDEIDRCSDDLVAGVSAYNAANSGQSPLSIDCKFDGKKTESGTFIASMDGLGGFDFAKDVNDTTIDTFSVAVDWESNELAINAVVGFVGYETKELSDADFGPLSFLGAERDEDYSQYSFELRLSSTITEEIEYLVGIYAQQSEFEAGLNVHANAEPSYSIAPTQISGTRISRFDQDSDTYAAFAQVIWYVQDSLRATLGLRYSEESKDVRKTQELAQLGGHAVVDLNDANTSTGEFAITTMFNSSYLSFAHDIRETRDEPNFLPSFNIEWDASEDTMAYFSVAKGFKGGGFDGVYAGEYDATNPEDVADFEFEEEEVISYEVGIKMRIGEGRGSLNIAVFRSDFEDVQVSAFNGALDVEVTNAGETSSQGFEIDGRWRLAEGLTLGGAYAYLDAQYEKYPNAQCYAGQTEAMGCVTGFVDDVGNLVAEDSEFGVLKTFQDLEGERTQFAPEHSASVNLEYMYWMTDDLRGMAYVEVIYSDEFFINVDNDPYIAQDAYTKANIRLSLGHDAQAWDLALLLRNITDEDTSSSGGDIPLFDGSRSLGLNRTRSYALQLRYQF